MRMPWRRLLAYSAHIPLLQTEEQLVWLMLQHGDPQKTQRQLRNQLTASAPSQAPKATDGALAEWLINPYLRQSIEIVETLPTPTPTPPTA
jgi:hypothetical protein